MKNGMSAKGGKIASLSVLSLAVLLLAGCGTQTPAENQTVPAQEQSTDENQPAQEVKVEENKIRIQGAKFEPAEITVKVGTTVKWVNMDPTNHSIKGSGMKSEILGTGKSFEHTFDAAGVYPYACGIHPTMAGKVIVEQ